MNKDCFTSGEEGEPSGGAWTATGSAKDFERATVVDVDEGSERFRFFIETPPMTRKAQRAHRRALWRPFRRMLKKAAKRANAA